MVRRRRTTWRSTRPGPPWPPPCAWRGSRIGLIATVSTTFHHPYNLARLFGTPDHVSNGRAAWSLVTSSVGEENFGPGGLPGPEDRYARAEEALEVVNALWDSWEAGALTAGADGAAVLDRDRVRPIGHSGRFFTVAGPLNIPPLPQRRVPTGYH
ncbi:LLM class flavin-dependent oxidoreductase [Streptomyces liangshanensis]|uniref:LLM class flavin-dependent oxidoreductase n=1 Tax=Streptomyces liangshanensis TaxID=2717324 RepID=UPI0036DCE7BD